RVGWLKADAAATMQYLTGSRLIDKKDPKKSLLLLKPLNEVKHGGGQKMLRGDLGYQAYRRWLEDYAAVVGGRYKREADLPAKDSGPERFGTEVWLKLDQTPPAWGDKLLRVSVYAWDAKAKAWEKEPVGVSDRRVWDKGRLWQHNLILLAAPGSERAAAWRRGRPALPPGRYLIKVHVDLKSRLAKDWKADLGPDDYAGQAEVTSRWPEGYGRMTVVKADRVKK